MITIWWFGKFWKFIFKLFFEPLEDNFGVVEHEGLTSYGK
jgi:hypothetical protein